VAPAPAPTPNLRAIVIIAVVIAAVALTIAANTQAPTRPATATPVKVEPITAAPPAAPAFPAAPPSPLLMCPTDAYKTRSGLVVCGVVAVDQQYVWVQQGWIATLGNFSAFTLYGDTSQCQFQLTGNSLSVNCRAPIAVGR